MESERHHHDTSEAAFPGKPKEFIHMHYPLKQLHYSTLFHSFNPSFLPSHTPSIHAPQSSLAYPVRIIPAAATSFPHRHHAPRIFRRPRADQAISTNITLIPARSTFRHTRLLTSIVDTNQAFDTHPVRIPPTAALPTLLHRHNTAPVIPRARTDKPRRTLSPREPARPHLRNAILLAHAASTH